MFPQEVLTDQLFVDLYQKLKEDYSIIGGGVGVIIWSFRFSECSV